MARDRSHRISEVEPETVEALTEEAAPQSGLKELPTKEEMEKALVDSWERQTAEREGFWINRRDFKVPSGAVPQGVIRPLEEAYALEVKRLE